MLLTRVCMWKSLRPAWCPCSLQVAVYMSLAAACALQWAGSSGFAPTGGLLIHATPKRLSTCMRPASHAEGRGLQAARLLRAHGRTRARCCAAATRCWASRCRRRDSQPQPWAPCCCCSRRSSSRASPSGGVCRDRHAQPGCPACGGQTRERTMPDAAGLLRGRWGGRSRGATAPTSSSLCH